VFDTLGAVKETEDEHRKTNIEMGRRGEAEKQELIND